MMLWRGRNAKRVGVVAGLAALALLAACDRKGAADRGDGEGGPGLAAAPERGSSQTLAAVKSRGRLNCGVNQGLVGFAYTDNRGDWRGFDADFCRATAAAVFGRGDAVRFVPLTNQNRLPALESGRIDVLWRNTSWTLSRDAEGFEYAGINYYDGQGFLVRRTLNLTSAAELQGARVCVQAGSTTQLNAADFFRLRGVDYTPVVVRTEEEARETYAREGCDAFTADVSALAAARSMLGNPAQHVILPDIVSKEPLGPVVRRGDEGWTEVVRWTLNALILAEELGVTQENAADLARTSNDPRVRRLLGSEGEVGAAMGLSKTWALDAIKAVGNYGEIFERNLGSGTALDLTRGLNAQWNATPRGLMYGLPIR